MRLIKWHIALLSLTLLFTFYGCSSDDEQSSSCDMLEFKFLSSQNSKLSKDVTGVIKDGEITVEVPSGTEVTTLVASFRANGESVRVGNTTQASGSTPNNFSKPVVYTVVAEDGTTKNYTVSVVRPDKDITSFIFEKAKNPQLPADAVGVITGSGASKIITVELYTGTERTALIPTFTATAAKVTVGGVVQVSGETPANFTQDVEYVVTAENNSAATYTVKINEITARITSFSFAKANNPGLADNVEFKIDHEAKTITGSITKWITTANADKFIPTFTAAEGTTVSVNNTAQQSGVNSLSFRDEVVYSVKQAGSSTPEEYKVKLLCPQVNATLPVMRFSVNLGDINSKEMNIASRSSK